MDMAEARGRHEWEQTALLAAILWNAHRGEKAPARGANDFNPYAPRKAKAAKVPDLPLRTWRKAFVGE